MDTAVAQLAMAALVGASLVAVSAYYMHRKTLDQLLEFAKSVDREYDEDEEEDGYESPPRRRGVKSGGDKVVRRRNYRRPSSSSLPDVTAFEAIEFIPAGLPRL